MMIIHDAAGPSRAGGERAEPVVAAVQLAPPGPFAIVFAETGRAGQGPRALIAPRLARRRCASGSPPGRTGPLTPVRA
jgi:hypothetical protein